ncbi:universal stress protein [Haloferax sp. MBLA0076]|uniref:Universal stress protein n=1 Tax=Haloferax litoreum TaxID=2666140 RepID=A0A6A8GJY3_9EURY|nr:MULTISPECIES: universal stress protein [Haloferax]KAB1190513.1 universal stress protein [Haloferax sp. CBA1148]MRX23493.1 universal stress protein [Haloferax litoreum]
MGLLDHVVVPIADETDAVETADALNLYLDGVRRVTAIHVIEKGGGVVDKAPMEKRRADAAHYLSVFDVQLGGSVDIDMRMSFGTNVAETILETAEDVEATAIAYRPRGGNRLVRLLSGDTGARLATNGELPVVSLGKRPNIEAISGNPSSDTDTEVRG